MGCGPSLNVGPGAPATRVCRAFLADRRRPTLSMTCPASLDYGRCAALARRPCSRCAPRVQSSWLVHLSFARNSSSCTTNRKSPCTRSMSSRWATNRRLWAD